MLKWFFRSHRETLDEAMKTLKCFNSLYELLYYVSCDYNVNISKVDLSFSSPFDERINWSPVYLVSVEGNGIGYCTCKFVGDDNA